MAAPADELDAWVRENGGDPERMARETTRLVEVLTKLRDTRALLRAVEEEKAALAAKLREVEAQRDDLSSALDRTIRLVESLRRTP